MTVNNFLSDNSPLQPTESEISWMSSVSFTSSIFAVLLCCRITDKYSHRQVLIFVAIFYTIAWTLILFTKSMKVIIICFWFYGIASGTQLVISYSYISEVSNPKNRELLGTAYHLSATLGIQAECLLAYLYNYQLQVLLPLFMSVIALGISLLMVESPYSLVDQNKDEQASHNLCYLNDRKDEKQVVNDLNMVRQYVNEQRSNRSVNMNLKTILMPANLKLTAIMVIVSGLSSIHTSYLVTYTGAFLLKDFKNFTNGHVFVTIYSTSRVILQFSTFITIKKFSRRTLFLVGYPTASLIQLIIGLCYYIESQNGNTIHWLADVIAYLLTALQIVVSLTFGIAVEILKMEVFPHELKKFCTSLLILSCDWFAFILVKSYYFAEPILGNACLMTIYALIPFVTVTIIYFCIHDTKEKTLLQIRTDINAKHDG